jgi:hypothetical protein
MKQQRYFGRKNEGFYPFDPVTGKVGVAEQQRASLMKEAEDVRGVKLAQRFSILDKSNNVGYNLITGEPRQQK